MIQPKIISFSDFIKIKLDSKINTLALFHNLIFDDKIYVIKDIEIVKGFLVFQFDWILTGNPGNPGNPGRPIRSRKLQLPRHWPVGPLSPLGPGNPGSPSNPGRPGNPGGPAVDFRSQVLLLQAPGIPGGPGGPGGPIRGEF